MTTTSSESIRLPSVLKPPPVEQVFSNPLLMQLILKNLDTQDHLQTALVSRDWRAKSRDFLKSKNCRIPMCVRIKYETGESPCRKLVELNEFLKTTPSSKSSMTITFNGIHYISNDGNDKMYKCQNCLFKHKNYDKNAVQTEVIQLYGQILKKIEFKYIWLKGCHCLDYNCPSTKLVTLILMKKKKEIMELNFSGCRFVVLSLGYLGTKRLFPKLEVLGMETNEIHENFPIRVPAIKRITDFKYNPFSFQHQHIRNFPLQAVTVLGGVNSLEWGRHDSVIAALRFVTDFQPKIEEIYFEAVNPHLSGGESMYSIEHRRDLFDLGRRISPNLKILQCSTLAFASLTTGSDGEDIAEENVHRRQCFPNLEKLRLDGSVGAEFMDWLNGIDYYKEFPKLREVKIVFSHPRYQTGNLAIGPINCFPGCVFKGVEILTLRGSQDLLFATLGLLQLFSNVQRVNLDYFGLKWLKTDPRFVQVINGIRNLPFLEELYLKPNISSMRELILDHLFQEKDSKNKAVARNFKFGTVYTPIGFGASK